MSIIYKNKIIIVKILMSILSFIVMFYITMFIYSLLVVSYYNDKILPNVYINTYDLSNINKDEIMGFINNVTINLENSNLMLKNNDSVFNCKFSDLGISIDKNDLYNKIIQYQNKLSYYKTLEKILGEDKISFSYKLTYDLNDMYDFFNDLKKRTDHEKQDGKLVMDADKNIKYVSSVPSFSLDIDKNIEKIIGNIYDLLNNNIIELEGKSEKGKDTDLSTIDAKVATYTTEFQINISRANNIKTAADSLNQVIIQPGEVFSFFKNAGPYNKYGYVYYAGVLANGVCQVASTIYNTALIGGLEIVERYAHAQNVPYVIGGLDATVSYSRYRVLDFKFKNTYKYPIYISSYTMDGKLTIEFWSNNKAKQGKTYEPKSERIGYNGFNTYLYTYENGNQTNKKYVSTDWYINQ